MKTFLDDNFLLQTKTAEKLYHDYAASMPIIDYHNHLPPADIANDRVFENISQAWLKGDHYKWRAMRANGINERYITGDATDEEKFLKWAETTTQTLRNPLFHWTHLELRRYFGINDILSKTTGKAIYDESSALLNTKENSVQQLLSKMKVEVVCTTDDPIDSLEHHKLHRDNNTGLKMLPTWRADKATAIDTPDYLAYINKLGEVSNVEIKNFNTLLEALQVRHDYFANMGCKLSDHGLDNFLADNCTPQEAESIFQKALSKSPVTPIEANKFKSGLLYVMALMDHSKGWVQQFHVGAIRNNNTRLLKQLGPDTGFDSIGDVSMAAPMSKFLDLLDSTNQLAKTILYNNNPKDNAVLATMIGNFQDGSTPGKMQFGSGWWFMDQKDGMENQINTLSNMGLLSRFVGMLTDSRSFLSFPRHEYFRRILCNLIGNDVENGELPNDMELLGKMVQDICYNNAKEYFDF
ncbi:MAG: glucuronate isomerase [Flavobacteriales bacterium]|nr:glucuronate isomerase [Flavobacteriales bacterium]